MELKRQHWQEMVEQYVRSSTAMLVLTQRQSQQTKILRLTGIVMVPSASNAGGLLKY